DEAEHALNENLMLFYIGNERSASEILKEQKENTQQEDKFKALQQMVGLVYDLRDALQQSRLDDVGHILHENWMLKQSLASGIASPMIGAIYDAARAAGASGGKLLGAGGGGFMLFYCPPDKREDLRRALKNIRYFPFRFEKGGSQLIYHGDK